MFGIRAGFGLDLSFWGKVRDEPIFIKRSPAHFSNEKEINWKSEYYCFYLYLLLYEKDKIDNKHIIIAYFVMTVLKC